VGDQSSSQSISSPSDVSGGGVPRADLPDVLHVIRSNATMLNIPLDTHSETRSELMDEQGSTRCTYGVAPS
jgi:hypothetical protein